MEEKTDFFVSASPPLVSPWKELWEKAIVLTETDEKRLREMVETNMIHGAGQLTFRAKHATCIAISNWARLQGMRQYIKESIGEFDVNFDHEPDWCCRTVTLIWHR